MAESAQLIVDGRTLELERVDAVNGNNGFRIESMLSQTGSVTLDVGFTNTASCTSKITYIDGAAGVLRHRGYPIDQLADSCTFLEVAFLLIYGKLPDSDTLGAFTRRIKKHRLLNEDYKHFFTSFPSNGHPMSMLQAAIAGLGTYYPHTLDPLDHEQLDLASAILIAKMPTLVAYAAKRATGAPLPYRSHNALYKALQHDRSYDAAVRVPPLQYEACPPHLRPSQTSNRSRRPPSPLKDSPAHVLLLLPHELSHTLKSALSVRLSILRRQLPQ